MNDTLAKKIYDKYCAAVGGKAYNGDDLPNSEEFFTDPTKEKQANAWRAACHETQELLYNCALNLGHPAYGHSSSTSIAIDDLREKALDFLEVPKD